MQGLNTMIRLSKFQLDEKKRKLSELRDLMQQVQHSLEMIEAEHRQEQDSVARADDAQQLDMARAYADYRAAASERKANLLRSIAEIEEEIQRISDDISEAFQELKRYEITQETRALSTRKTAARREQAALDEFGLQAFRRRGQG
jgi:flagellar protein FliJ